MAQLLKDKTAVGASAPLFLGNPAKDHTVEVRFGSTESPTAVTIDLEGSLGGSDFFQLATYSFTAGDLAAKKAMFHVVNKPVDHVRLNLTTLTGVATIQGHYEGQ